MIGGTKRMCEEFVLSNGLRVVAEPIENYPSVSVGLWIGAGSMYESAEENGLSHFVEHILFKSTENRTTKQIAVEMDALGGQVNAFTAKECTCYYAKVIAEHLPRAMDLLCDMLLNARVDEAEFEKERGVILEEIAMCEDTPEDLVYDLLAEAYFGEHPAGLVRFSARTTRLHPSAVKRCLRSKRSIIGRITPCWRLRANSIGRSSATWPSGCWAAGTRKGKRISLRRWRARSRAC